MDIDLGRGHDLTIKPYCCPCGSGEFYHIPIVQVFLRENPNGTFDLGESQKPLKVHWQCAQCSKVVDPVEIAERLRAQRANGQDTPA